MKALVYDGPKAVSYREVPDPIPSQDNVLIKIKAVGICGSDMHAYLGHDERRPAPLILGHEAAGTISGGDRDGERVTINPLVSCGTCWACCKGRENICPNRQIISMPPREGAFAQYVTMPEQNLVIVPSDYSLQKAALVEPLAVGWHTAKLAVHSIDINMEKRALIIGGGAIGLATALALRAMGIDDIVISEFNPLRREYLQEHIDAKVVEKTEDSFPIVIDAVGFGTTRAVASQLVSPGGVIAHVGLGDNADGLDIRRFTLQEITFIGTYTYTAQDFKDTAEALFTGRLGLLEWIERRPLSEGEDSFKDLLGNNVAAPKIVLEPWA
jgi:threonine dehydrogenase-like Zn-dependent dehydrogenase